MVIYEVKMDQNSETRETSRRALKAEVKAELMTMLVKPTLDCNQLSMAKAVGDQVKIFCRKRKSKIIFSCFRQN